MSVVEKGNSRCAYYYQNPDKSDLGTWRLPNEAELMIMAGSLYDWDDREKKEVYNFFQGDKFYSLNMTDGQVIHSRTGFSKRDMNGARSFSAFAIGARQFVGQEAAEITVSSGFSVSWFTL